MPDAARTQLRMYQIEPGWMGEFMESFRAVVTARAEYGFTVDGAWVVDGEDRFVWLATYHGDGDWDEAVERYYNSPERQALDPDPATFIVSMDTKMVHPAL